jgi:flagellar hook-associated protein 1 FlgK
MGSLTSLINLAKGALSADQTALATTANNVSNQNTVGYTREVATFRAGDSVTLSSGQSSGAAPTVLIVSQRDRVLEQRVQQQAQAGAATDSRAGVLSQLDNVFGISGSSATAGSTQIGASIDAFFSSLSALSANPSDSPTQQAVINTANTLANSISSAATQVGQVTNSVNSDLANSVKAVNGLTSTIAQLNVSIAAVSANGDAGPLEDQRQSAIAQLSQYIGLDQITTEHNGITLTTSGGTPLVAAGSSFALSAVSVAGALQIQDSTGANLNSQITGGSIGGELTALSVDIPATTNALDTLAYRIGTAVNTQNAAGLTSSGVAGGAIFAVPGSSAGAAAGLSVIPTSGSAVAAAGPGEGSSGSSNALALAAIQQATNAAGTTIDSSYGALLANVGNTGATLTEQSTAQQATLTQLTTQRDSLSTVNLDEEAANLQQYQNSYNAASKLFTIVNSIMVSAINLGVQTTVS